MGDLLGSLDLGRVFRGVFEDGSESDGGISAVMRRNIRRRITPGLPGHFRTYLGSDAAQKILKETILLISFSPERGSP